MTLNIVLLEPQIPQNVGNIARTCAVTGVRLHLVEPMGFTIDDKKLKRAGLDYWHLLDITHYNDVSEFFRAVTDGVLTSDGGVADTSPDTSAFNFYFFETRLGRVYTEPKYEDNVYLFFGSETVGIDKNLLEKNPDQCVHIPMIENSRSMNLSSTVAIGVFEVLRQWNFPDLLSQHQNSQLV